MVEDRKKRGMRLRKKKGGYIALILQMKIAAVTLSAFWPKPEEKKKRCKKKGWGSILSAESRFFERKKKNATRRRMRILRQLKGHVLSKAGKKKEGGKKVRWGLLPALYKLNIDRLRKRKECRRFLVHLEGGKKNKRGGPRGSDRLHPTMASGKASKGNLSNCGEGPGGKKGGKRRKKLCWKKKKKGATSRSRSPGGNSDEKAPLKPAAATGKKKTSG